jgi:prevent-host-death family protein
MQNSSIHEAKIHLSKLIELALSGEEVIISQAGKPLVRLVKYEGISQPRTPGGWQGQITIADDFDEESPTVHKMFYGE